MKWKSLVAFAALFGGAHAADAALLLYQLEGTVPGKYTASFTLDTDRVPSISIPNNSVRYNGVPITFTRPNSTVVETAAYSNSGPTFSVLTSQGGVFLGYLGGFPTQFSVYGPQLFTGTTTAPVFLTGTFGLSDIPRNRTTDPIQVNYTLTVTDISSAVPEPATWAMMLVGFGGIGTAIRRRTITTRVSSAA
ncbi:PEP-CTERM sorting domain-containing protein [Sphingomonas sp. AP4-R1]|uniref:PEPxxWA-CTERM sorting domain-containing protein n=1 Tax=Sphingomonas sp. AP4-R1 TaxID=2735134 RepID=UPI0014933476|nr:PEPxxWA-CTERM sorting domain-containing protein [Sphingomonas sp. AP4-R1]QJU57071.1 PEP-CTERM sorting domain-containing protein [Sphingomonas sp. AP4-R1]